MFTGFFLGFQTTLIGAFLPSTVVLRFQAARGCGHLQGGESGGGDKTGVEGGEGFSGELGFR